MSRLIRCGSSSFRPIGSVSGLLSPPRLAAGQAPDRSVVNRPIRRVGLSPTNSPASLAAAAHLDTAPPIHRVRDSLSPRGTSGERSAFARLGRSFAALPGPTAIEIRSADFSPLLSGYLKPPEADQSPRSTSAAIRLIQCSLALPTPSVVGRGDGPSPEVAVSRCTPGGH